MGSLKPIFEASRANLTKFFLGNAIGNNKTFLWFYKYCCYETSLVYAKAVNCFKPFFIRSVRLNPTETGLFFLFKLKCVFFVIPASGGTLLIPQGDIFLSTQWEAILTFLSLQVAHSCSQIHSPWGGDKVDSGMGMSYRPASLYVL